MIKGESKLKKNEANVCRKFFSRRQAKRNKEMKWWLKGDVKLRVGLRS